MEPVLDDSHEITDSHATHDHLPTCMITDTTNVYLFTSIKLILMHKRTMISKDSCICVTRARMFIRIVNRIFTIIFV